MKFIIKHELQGRIRIHTMYKRLTLKQADILEYYLNSHGNVTSAKVYERTMDAVIEYSGDRDEIIRLLSKFSFENVTVPTEVIESSGREINREYQEKLIIKILKRCFNHKKRLCYGWICYVSTWYR